MPLLLKSPSTIIEKQAVRQLGAATAALPAIGALFADRRQVADKPVAIEPGEISAAPADCTGITNLTHSALSSAR
jgi:hypothetical protein